MTSNSSELPRILGLAWPGMGQLCLAVLYDCRRLTIDESQGQIQGPGQASEQGIFNTLRAGTLMLIGFLPLPRKVQQGIRPVGRIQTP